MTILDDMPARLAAAADYVESTKTAARLAVAQRNQLIVDAIDEHGMSQQLVAKHARVSQPHVIRVLAYSDEPAAAG